MGSKNKLIVGPHGQVCLKRVPIVRSSEGWAKYASGVYEIVNYELGLRIQPMRQDERVVFDCRWFLRSARSDCVNFHDLLADALKRAFDVDDRWFLIRDRWSEVDESNPRVEVTMFKERPGDSPAACSHSAAGGLQNPRERA